MFNVIKIKTIHYDYPKPYGPEYKVKSMSFWTMTHIFVFLPLQPQGF